MRKQYHITIAAILLTATFGLVACGDGEESSEIMVDTIASDAADLPTDSDTASRKVADTTDDMADTAGGGDRRSPALSWDFDIKEDPKTTNPTGSVGLMVNGKRHTVIANAEMQFNDLHGVKWETSGVPEDALIAAESWWAGMGSVVYVIQEGSDLVAYQKHIDEMSGEPGTYSEIARIPLN